MKANVKIILLIGLLFSLSIPANAQDESEEIKLPSERYALLFQIGENFNLSSFDGSVISFKYHFENSNALRIGFSIDGYSEDQNYLERINSMSDESESEEDKIYFRINTLYLTYSELFNNVSFYYGAGPFLSYSYMWHHYIDPENGTNTTEQDYWNFGLDFTVGTEFIINKNLSLNAEYGMSIWYSKSDYETIDYNLSKFENEGSKYLFKGSGVKLGLTVYL